ncbi:MAG: 8-oxo-dGTP diphosphatase [Candidatus Moranbacteria bacterium]|nr:8-oxo-dGTP diphosphatase [Candidatus Moranbacteria bacterium]
MNKILTLCIIHQGDRVLLGMKKRGFGMGRWNGFGGKVEKGETIEEAARREVFEEACIDVTDLQKVGIIEFEWQGNPEILEVHIFRATQFVGEPAEGEEMQPQWFSVNEIPLKDMWPDDEYWIPMFLEGKKFTGKILFGKGDSVLECALKEEESIA